MKALEIQALTGPTGLMLVERDEPDAGSHVLIDVYAAGVSFPDLLVAQGAYQVKPELPHVPGLEIAGIVRSAPADSSIEPGDRVWAFVDAGGFAETAAVPIDRVFSLDPALSFVEGAALGVNYLTAVFALRRRARLDAGETVVVLGAGGGLGTASVRVAKAYGARVFGIVSSDAKAASAVAAGADDVFVGDEWRDWALERTSGGADLVVDVVGGDQTLAAIRSTAPEGRVLVLGFTAGEVPKIATNRLLLRNISLLGAGLGALMSSDPALLPSTSSELTRLISLGLRPLVGSTLPLSAGADALNALQRREALGKIVLTVDGRS